jgi:predicted transcriptional regulator
MSPRENGSGFGHLEAEVMESVWDAAAPVSVREVVDALNEGRREPLAYTTVMTVMSRLAEKHALTRSKAGRGYLYEASAADAAGIAVKDLLRDHGDAAIAHFVEEVRGDPAAIRRLRRLLAESGGDDANG